MDPIHIASVNQYNVGNCLKVSEVAKKLSIGKSTVWQKLHEDPTFPRSFSLFEGGKATRWLESEIDDYIMARRSGGAQ